MMPLLRSIPQRAIVRLLRYLRTLMLHDSGADVGVAGGRDCEAVPSLHRVVEWGSMCMDAVGLQVMHAFCAELPFNSVQTRACVTLWQLATTQEGREICAGLKRAAQVQKTCFTHCFFVTFWKGTSSGSRRRRMTSTSCSAPC